MKKFKLLSSGIAMLICVAVLPICASAQKIKLTITGVVSDATGPIPGATVAVQNTSRQTQTDMDGRYSIMAHKGETLIYGFVGMQEKRVKVGTQKMINVTLEEGLQLQEVVVTGVLGLRRTRDVVVASHQVMRAGTLVKKEVAQTNRRRVPADAVANEEYDKLNENPFQNPLKAALSTFSIDVDNASYTNVRRFINLGQKVPTDAVRVEEMVNFFKYDYPQPTEDPFSINTDMAECPWNPGHKLLRVGLQGKIIPTENLPASNLVFLIDVSGSMSDENKLPLLKQSMKLLLRELRPIDKVSIVVYAGAAGVVLEPTPGNSEKIAAALENLESGGSTAGGAGIELAYKLAAENFIKNGNNRVILATDGDFNVGASSPQALEELIEAKRKTGVFLTVLGYGMGNYKDNRLELLANKGNGNYAYIDNIQEAKRFLGKEFKGSLYAIAKDVKIQMEFNPAHVQSYRLIGYENRLLRDEDFIDDTIDAGELGSGHTVTALYEIIPHGVKSAFAPQLPRLKYTKSDVQGDSRELATIKFRYKKPEGDKSIEMTRIVRDADVTVDSASDDMRFATAVAWFGLTLRDSKLITGKSTREIARLASAALGRDHEGYRSEFVRLISAVQ